MDVPTACHVYQELNDNYYTNLDTGEETHYKFSITYAHNEQVEEYVAEAERKEEERKAEEERQKLIRQKAEEEEARRQRQQEEERRREQQAREEQMRLERVEQEKREAEQRRRDIEEEIENLKQEREAARIKTEELNRLRAESRERAPGIVRRDAFLDDIGYARSRVGPAMPHSDVGNSRYVTVLLNQRSYPEYTPANGISMHLKSAHNSAYSHSGSLKNTHGRPAANVSQP